MKKILFVVFILGACAVNKAVEEPVVAPQTIFIEKAIGEEELENGKYTFQSCAIMYVKIYAGDMKHYARQEYAELEPYKTRTYYETYGCFNTVEECEDRITRLRQEYIYDFKDSLSTYFEAQKQHRFDVKGYCKSNKVLTEALNGIVKKK